MKTFKKIFLVVIFTFVFKFADAQEFYFCESVDDNWQPVGASKIMKSSEGMNFLAKLKNKVYDQVYMWVIYKMDDNGKDTEFVNEYAMTVGSGEGARFFCTTQKVYLDPGKYRVYFIFENDKETHFKSGNLTKYLAKGEVTVE